MKRSQRNSGNSQKERQVEIEEDKVQLILSGLLEEATETMVRLSAGMAVCTFTKSGKSVPGIKYAEGRWASLRDLERAIAKGTSVEDALEAGLKNWEPKLTASIEKGANADWTAYHHGTVDALTEFADQTGLGR